MDVIELTEDEVWLIQKKFDQLQQIQQRLQELNQDVVDAIRQLLKFKGLPEEYDLAPPDETNSRWRLIKQEEKESG